MLKLKKNQNDPKEQAKTANSSSDQQYERSLDSIVTPGQLVLKRFMRNKLAITGIFILLFFFIFSFLGPFFAPYGEYQLNYHMEASQRLYVTTADNHLLRIRLGDGLFDWDIKLEQKITGKPVVDQEEGKLFLPVEGGVVMLPTSADSSTSLTPEFISGGKVEELATDPYEWENGSKPGFEFKLNEKSQLVEVKQTKKGEKERVLGGDDYIIQDENSWFVNREGSAYGATKEGVITEFRPGQRSTGWSIDLSKLGYKAPYNISPSISSSKRLLSYAGPSWKHIFGTDKDGRDVFTRLMYGGRISLMVGFVVVFIQIILGIIFGGISGYYGGWVDGVIMRLVDIFFCLPTLPLIMMINTSLTKTNVISPESSIYILMAVLGVLGWAGVARFVRGQILSLREQEYMIAAEATGLKVRHRISRHLIPNVMPLLIVMATLGIGGTILYESSLSFLGFGLQYPYASWGNMVNPVTDPIVMQKYLNIWLPPGICILLTVMAFNFVGDGLRDALDPRMKR